MSLHASNPIDILANSLYSACYRDLPDIHYEEIDFDGREKLLNNIDDEEVADYLERECSNGTLIYPVVEKVRRPTVNDCEVVAMFPQMWGSTALGFGGLGGAAMTSAYTTVINCDKAKACAVYFGGRFAYLVPRKLDNNIDNEGWNRFMVDIAKSSLVSIADCLCYRTPEFLNTAKSASPGRR